MSRDKCDRCGNGPMYHAMGSDHSYSNAEESAEDSKYREVKLEARIKSLKKHSQ